MIKHSESRALEKELVAAYKSLGKKDLELLEEWEVDYKREPESKPVFVEKIKQIEKEKSIRVDDFAKRYGLKK